MSFYKKEAKVMLSPVKVEKKLKDSIIGVSAQLEKNYTDTMIYLLELGIKAHLDIKVVERGSRGSSKIPVEVKEMVDKVEKKAPAKRFVAPGVHEVAMHMREGGANPSQALTEAEKFVNYWSDMDWKRGKTRMKSWKGSASNWVKNGFGNRPAANRGEVDQSGFGSPSNVIDSTVVPNQQQGWIEHE